MGTQGPSVGNREDDSEGDDESGAEDGPLVSIYRTYVGEPESRLEVYAGFGTFFAGVALGVTALVVFLYSTTQPEGTDLFWASREAALVFGLLALPAIGLSVTALLPVGRRTTVASLVGAAVCIAGIAWLTQAYPYAWTGERASNVITVYAAGLVFLTASTGAALVAQYLERMSTTEPGTEEPSPDDEGEAVTDEQVAADIEDAMSDSELTWGGVEREPNVKRLELNMPDVIDEENTERMNVTPDETRSSGEGVDDAVDGLRQFQGGDRDTARAESPDDQVAALTEFRDRQDGADIETGVDERTPIDRLLASLRGLLDRLRARLRD